MKLFNFLKGLFIKRNIFPNLCIKTDCPCMGDCCRYAFNFGDYYILTRHGCKYLDEKTNLCKIYPKRLEINPNCHNMKEMYKLGCIPEKCPYLKIRPMKKKLRPGKINYLPNDTNKTDRFNWEVFNDSHRDFVKHYFNEKDHWVDCFIRWDEFMLKENKEKRKWIKLFKEWDRFMKTIKKRRNQKHKNIK